MTIGEKIKALRQKNDVTQEKLAEYLNITYQSISKWETGNAMPDISMVLPLANFFGVSIDELFDRDSEMQAAELKEYEDRDYELSHNKNKETILERLSIWRGAVQKYPKNFRCLVQLAYALHDTLDRTFDDALIQENAKEVVSICERILRDCTDSGHRESAVQLLVYTYGCQWCEIADEEKAEKYAKMAGSYYTCTENLLEHAYFTEEGKKKGRRMKHSNRLDFMCFLTDSIFYEDGGRPPEEEIFACETIIRLWETLFYDGNFGWYNGRMAGYTFELAKNYAILGRREETLAALEKAIRHGEAFDALDVGDHPFTSVFVNAASRAVSFPDDNSDWIRNYLKQNYLDFVREDPEFLEIAKKYI